MNKFKWKKENYFNQLQKCILELDARLDLLSLCYSHFAICALAQNRSRGTVIVLGNPLEYLMCVF